MHFQRFIGIDWSGAATADDRVNLRLVESGPHLSTPRAITPPESSRAKNWTRNEVRRYLLDALHPHAPRTLVAIDAAIGYPTGAASAIFDASTFSDLAATVAKGLAAHPDLPSYIDALNLRAAAHPTGVPFFYRGSDLPDRSWHRPHHRPHSFFTHHGIAYYRLVETFVPESLSPFYIGPGPMVAYHALTVLRLIHHLFEARQQSTVDVGIWPLDPHWSNAKHLIAECYPSALPQPRTSPTSNNPHYLDALTIADWLHHLSTDDLNAFLHLDSTDSPAPLLEVATNEGWILGIPLPRSLPYYYALSTR